MLTHVVFQSTSACPTPQAQFNASPPTFIKEENEVVERSCLLPEVEVVISRVSNLIGEVNATTEPSSPSDPVDGARMLPWKSDETSDDVTMESAENTSVDDENKDPNLRTKLKALAPLLDRLGRTLIDAAPHVAAYANTLPEKKPQDICRREGETNVVVAGGDDAETSSSGQTPATDEPAWRPEDDVDDEEIEPDYVDFVNGMVNTSRGEVRARVNRGSGQDDGASLLGAYLAAASLSSLVSDDESNAETNSGGLQGLGRLLRQRENNGGTEGNGNGGGGIDIHIHAIVTGPGVGAGTGGGLAVLGDPQVAVARPTLFSNTRRVTAAERPIPNPTDEEDMGIFADLYSENPSPVDLQSGVLPSAEENQRPAATAIAIEDLGESEEFVTRLRNDRTRVTETAPRSPRRRTTDPTGRRGGLFSRVFRRNTGRRSSSNSEDS